MVHDVKGPLCALNVMTSQQNIVLYVLHILLVRFSYALFHIVQTIIMLSPMGRPLCKKYAKTGIYKYCGSILYIRMYIPIHPDLYYTSGSILYIRIYTIHPDLYYTSGSILYIRIYTIHLDLYYTSGSILYIRIYTIHPDLYYTSGSILYIRIYTIHPDLYYTSGSILYIRIYTVHLDLCCIFRYLAMHLWQHHIITWPSCDNIKPSVRG